jgi:lysophospholipase L1-like esterase
MKNPLYKTAALIAALAVCIAWFSALFIQNGEIVLLGEEDSAVIAESSREEASEPAIGESEIEMEEETEPVTESMTEATELNDAPVTLEKSSAVPESEPVEPSYFDDAIFFGDSISTGIQLYHIADNAAVVAMTGINPYNVNTNAVIPVEVGSEERVTFLEAAKAYGERGKVYIMLGGNGIALDKELFIDGYRTFVESVKKMYPNAVIYLQGMTPVTADYVNEYDPSLEIDNATINDYNLEILALAEEQGVYYLDVGSALKDESGALPKEASPLDGMHFSPEYYVKWFDYLKAHTVH